MLFNVSDIAYICHNVTIHEKLFMKALLNKTLFPFAAAAACLCSCVNEDYDLEKVKVDQIHVLDNIALPIGSSSKMVFSELIDVDEFGDFLKMYDNGDYYFSLLSGNISETIEVPEFSINGFDLDAFQTSLEGTFQLSAIVPGITLPTIPLEKIEYDIIVDQPGFPEFISELIYADVKTNIGIRFDYDLKSFPFNKVYLAEGLTLSFPEWVVLGDAPAGFKKEGNILTAHSPIAITPSKSTISVPVEALDLRNVSAEEGLLNGHLYLKAHVELSNGGVYVVSDDCVSTGTFSPSFATSLHVDEMEIESVQAKINISELADIKTSFVFDEMSELLDNENYTLDLDGLNLDLSIESNMPFDLNFHASAQTYANGSEEPLWKKDIEVPSAGNHSYLLGEFPLNPIPERIDFEILPEFNKVEVVTITPGSTYDVAVGYSLTCDAFGKDFRISINHDITDLGLEVEDVTVEEAQLKLTLVNALPFNLDLDVQTIDAEGNALDSITAEIEGEIKGGSVESPAENQLTLRLTSNGPLALDGIRLSLTTSVSGDRAVLNKDQYIQMKDISICLPKGVTYYINENN